MAIVHESYASTAQSTAQTSITINKPTGTVSGDVLVVGIQTNGSYGTLTLPSGWQLISENKDITNPDSITAYLVAGGSEPTSYTFNWTSSIASGGGISRFSGVDNTTPIDVTPVNSSSSTTTNTPVLTGVTIATANAVLIASLGPNSSSTTIDAGSSGMTEQWEEAGKKVALYTETIASTGATGTRTLSFSANRAWSGVMYALRPASAGGTTHNLTATGSADVTATAALSRADNLEAAGSADITSSADLTVVAIHDLAVTGSADATTTADLSVVAIHDLATTGSGDITTTALLSLGFDISSNGTADITLTAALDVLTGYDLSATGSVEASTTAHLIVTHSLIATGEATVAVTADLTNLGSHNLEATGNAATTAIADLLNAYNLSATGSADITAAADLSVIAGFDLSASGSAAVTITDPELTVGYNHPVQIAYNTAFSSSLYVKGGLYNYGGNLYLMVRDSTSRLTVYTSTGGTGSWSILDATNRPAAVTAYHHASIIDGSGIIHAITANQSSPNTTFYYHKFNTNTGTWDSVNNVIVTLATTENGYIDLAKRSNGDIVVFHPGAREDVGGTLYARPVYSIYNGSTWTTNLPVITGEAIHHGVASIVVDSDDGFYLFYSATKYKYLNSSNVLGTEGTITAIPTPVRDNSYTENGVETIIQYGRYTDSRLKALYTQSGSHSVVNIGTVTDIRSAFTPSIAGGFDSVNEKIFLVYVDTTNQNLNLFVGDNTRAWTGPTALVNVATTLNINYYKYIDATMYTASNLDKILGFVYIQGNYWYYDEYLAFDASDLSTAGSTETTLVAALTNTFNIQSSASVEITVTADLTSLGNQNLEAIGSTDASVTANLSVLVAHDLAATGLAATPVTADLQLNFLLTATAEASVLVTADLTNLGNHDLASTGSAAISVEANLHIPRDLAATGSAAASAAAAMSLARNLFGEGTLVTTVSANAKIYINLASTSNAAITVIAAFHSLVAVQNHIHLSSTLGGAPEYAPSLKWGVTAFDKKPAGFWNVNYSLTGTAHTTVLVDGSSNPLTYEDYTCSIYIVAEDGYTFQDRLNQLKAMQGRVVYFIENYHENDGQDHSGSVRSMFVEEVRGEEPSDPLITHAEVKVSLLDAAIIG